MLNLLWLLLPVAAAAGWFAGRNGAVSGSNDAYWKYTSNFHKGLSQLFNDRQANPSELFENLEDSDRDTADTHLALGNLYRRRGEVDKAILLHESLLAKPELGDEVAAAARYELARDYDSAGLLDRSETIFRELIDRGQRVEDATTSLLQLHERERDWSAAIEVASQLAKVSGEPRNDLVAHYLCEMAVQAEKDGYADQAPELLHKALKENESCARAHMALATIAIAQGDSNTAINHLDRVETHRPELMPEIIQGRFKALIQSDDKNALQEFIKRIQSQRNAYSVIRTTRGVIEEHYGHEPADKFFKEQILKRPSLKGLRDWAQDQLELSKPGERDKVAVICSMLDQVVEDKPTYQCEHCGFRGNVLHWRCPSCGTWDSVQPIIGVEGE
ncbi:MAG: lipopolysaccharide assembly protein LapB [Gammaproteobacteria bacterium]|nr:lipopolysaccharide assembly protein LapB [Gammaproteobacteria bacterium]